MISQGRVKAILAIFTVFGILQILGAFQIIPQLSYISIPIGLLGIMIVALYPRGG
ncbi:hypothetical protein IIA94_00830 [Patescibacteria group bacterium]|nr:hypothetical protein [Patescibacteria group bacterium]